MSYESKLASRCQGVAACLSYNAGKPESDAKRALMEASHALDHNVVRVYRSKRWMFVRNARGNNRRLGWRECLAVWLLKGRTEIRP